MNEKTSELFNKYHGNLSQKIAKENGINPTTLRRLVEKDEIEQPYLGIYVRKDEFLDNFFALQQKFSTGIYSHETALVLHDLTDLNLSELDMTFPAGFNRKGLSTDYPVIQHFTKKEWHSIGIEKKSSPAGNFIDVYDMERTLCDVFSKRYKPDESIKNEAVKRYFAHDGKDLRKLRRYMRTFEVRNELYTIMEVMI